MSMIANKAIARLAVRCAAAGYTLDELRIATLAREVRRYYRCAWGMGLLAAGAVILGGIGWALWLTGGM